jgi:hypothetical protein
MFRPVNVQEGRKETIFGLRPIADSVAPNNQMNWILMFGAGRAVVDLRCGVSTRIIE